MTEADLEHLFTPHACDETADYADLTRGQTSCMVTSVFGTGEAGAVCGGPQVSPTSIPIG